MKNGNLATNISSIELINGQGDVIKLSKDDDLEKFNGSIVNLGSLGLVTKMTLELIPTFQVRQDVYLNLPMSELENNFVEIMSGGYSVSLFHDWQTENINQVWKKSVVIEGDDPIAPPKYFRAVLALKDVHPIIEISAENCTEQMGVPGPWFERLPHFKMGFTPSSGEELQAEYFIPLNHAVDAIKAVATLKDEIKPFILITEIRSIAQDQLWMSPCHEQPSIAIHFTLKQDIDGVNKLLPLIEEKLKPYNPKPHWGKLFSFEPAYLQSQYPRLNDFKKLVNEFDPEGKFRNNFIEKYIYS
jgi:xylitol oxidase